MIAALTGLLLATAPAIELGGHGSIARSGDTGSTITAGFEGAYRFQPQLSLGIYTSPFVSLREPSGCPDGASCTIAGGQAGILASYRLFPEQHQFEPWLGVGLGIDVLQRKESTTTRSSGVIFSSTSTRENEHFFYGPTALFQAGLDIRATGSFLLGPWAAFGVGKYLGEKTRSRLNSEELDSSSGAANKPVHTWFMAGLHVMFEIQLKR
jgi:hypothetical protein